VVVPMEGHTAGLAAAAVVGQDRGLDGVLRLAAGRARASAAHPGVVGRRVIHPAPKPAPGKPRRRREKSAEKIADELAAKQMIAYKKHCRAEVVARSKGRCEYETDAMGRCIDPGRDWHHSCGRSGKGITAMQAHSPALTTYLCKRHHGQAHGPGGQPVKEALRMAVARRLGIVVDLRVTTALRAIQEHLAA
jgi:hypothetical protein